MQLEQLGPYRLGPRLGKGGMGSVYQAANVDTGQRVAVKALAPQLAAAEGFRERFEAEIESLKKLQHEGIVRLFGYGEDNGVLFYSMELVEGPSLEQELNAGRRFDWNETLSIAIQVCRALKHAHDHGVVHRDIKPANLLLTKGDERVKIADFGIARLFGATQLTTAGGILGTADYMSPEQVDGRPVTERCDQYALGCVMFALLAGRPPFRAKSMAEMLQLQRYAEPEPVRRYSPQTPDQLERLIGQLLSKDPANRFPNVLVLSRHMEAMQKALSRPAKPSTDERTSTGAAWGDPDATSAPAMDATIAQESVDLQVVETTDSDVYEAPTLADDGQLVAGGSAAIANAAPRAKPAVQAAPPAAIRENRFTTVDAAARRTQQERTERLVVTLQLAALAAALAALAWLGWKWTRPLSADALYARMELLLDESDQDPQAIDDEVGEFLQRYPDDPRAAKVQEHADELELRRLERRLRARARLTGAGAAHPAVQVYADAIAIAEADPARAAAMLQDLLALYPESGAGPGATDAQQYLELARRQLARLSKALDERAADQLPQLAERMAAARKLEDHDAQRAEGIYRALVSLYADEPWAAQIVAAAQERLADLSRSDP